MRNWVTSANRLLRSASKPDLTEFWLLFRVCLVGVALIGAIGFVIRFLFSLVGLAGGV